MQAAHWCLDFHPDVVVVEQEERDLFAVADKANPTFDTPWSDVQGRLSSLFDGASPVFVCHNSTTHDLTDAFVDMHGAPSRPPATRVAIVALGARTGVTLQRMFLDTRAHWGPGIEIAGVVVHAHPRDQRTWESIRNTFKDHRGQAKLVALWLTCIPRRSPMVEEVRVLESLDMGALGDEARNLVQRRIRGESPETLWSSEPHLLRPTSYFGEGLTAPRVLLALGSAVQAARQEARTPGNPDWVVFDLPTIFRSFFDGLIHASVLRWLEPSECWWGDREQDCVHLLQEIGIGAARTVTGDSFCLSCSSLLPRTRFHGQAPNTCSPALRRNSSGCEILKASPTRSRTPKPNLSPAVAQSGLRWESPSFAKPNRGTSRGSLAEPL